MFIRKYSYTDFLSQNRLSTTSNIAVVRHIDSNNLNFCYLSNGQYLSIEDVVKQVCCCQLKLKNPQLLRNWSHFDNGKFIVDKSVYTKHFKNEGDVEDVEDVEESEEPFEYVPLIFNTQYEAMIYCIYKCFIKNPIGKRFKDRKKLGDLNLAKSFANTSLNRPAFQFFETENDYQNQKFSMKIETNYTEIMPNYFTYTVNAYTNLSINHKQSSQLKLLFAIKPLHESEISKFRKDGFKLVNDLDTYLKFHR